MKRRDKADRIFEILEDLYPIAPIPLDHHDPYTLLVAVMLSAQTTDKKVNQVTPSLFEVADTPSKMADQPVAEIAHLIRQIGLAPTKAKNLSKMAFILRDTHNSIVPQTFAELEALPGVGHKTASVVMAQAFGFPAFPVDTHIHRLAARWGLSDGKNVTKTERDLKRTFAKPLWNKLHLQIIYFGREYCPARGHDLTTCPICGWAASKKRVQQERPTPRRRNTSAKRS